MADNAVVHSSVHLGTVEEMDGFGFAVEIKVEGVDEELMKAAHEVCLDSLMNCRLLLKNGFPSSAHTVVFSPMEPQLQPKEFKWPDPVCSKFLYKYKSALSSTLYNISQDRLSFREDCVSENFGRVHCHDEVRSVSTCEETPTEDGEGLFTRTCRVESC